jgi:uncharacterized protein
MTMLFGPDFRPSRASNFSYKCNACSHCCREKIIRLNPYDVARLALRFRISTSVFIKAYTCAAGSVLRVPDAGACVFLDRKGCSVHADRPLVCRLYPLGRNTSDSGDETFSLIEPDAECIGTFGDKGTVADYLLEQDAIESLAKVDEYLALYERLLKALRHVVRNNSCKEGVIDMIGPPSITGTEPVPAWLDMDFAVSWHCARYGLELPQSLHQKTELHISAVGALLTGIHEEGWAWPDIHPATDRSRSARGTQPSAPDTLTAVQGLARMTVVLGYSLGVNIEELATREFGPDPSSTPNLR